MTSNSNSTWSPPQLGFQLKRIPYPWTHLGSNLAHPSLDSSLLELKALIPLWPWTPSQFGLVSSIFFLSSPGQLTRVTFTLSAYPIGLPKSHPNNLSYLHPSALPKPYLIASMLTQPYTSILSLIRPYPALHDLTRPNYLAQSFPDRTSAYPIIPGHQTRLPCSAG
jgi:hypothetical protein